MNAHATAPSAKPYVSPPVADGAASTRTEAEVRRARNPMAAFAADLLGYGAPLTLPKPDALANQATFTIWARHPGQIRLWSVEAPMLQTMAEALEELKQHDRAVMVTQSDPDVPTKDVSEDMARAWLKELWAHGFDPTEESVPAFVGEHLTNDEIERAE